MAAKAEDIAREWAWRICSRAGIEHDKIPWIMLELKELIKAIRYGGKE